MQSNCLTEKKLETIITYYDTPTYAYFFINKLKNILIIIRCSVELKDKYYII